MDCHIEQTQFIEDEINKKQKQLTKNLLLNIKQHNNVLDMYN